ncbi:NFX1-type zinc finger-containing protein 1-like isoform X1 [Dreissena polymorpha]|uniref:NFX1-type zinc finger-containing protein 1-like isoform X1 n=1 Tax=Dreissena polymorpha TaxID=45954 RepID=UPI002263CB2E|nr:NFX1-type zinc finger-containing protein 1-like isoform X1 [Dreissena polymorpha]XP_052246828.1 NFX1-type zinc finger-containing protein 1-like isoform X1 [Dreissena polymorpha]
MTYYSRRRRRSRGEFRNGTNQHALSSGHVHRGGKGRGGNSNRRSETFRGNRARTRGPRNRYNHGRHINRTEDPLNMMLNLQKEDSGVVAVTIAQDPSLLWKCKRLVQQNRQYAEKFFGLLLKVFDNSSAHSSQKEIARLLEQEEVLQFGLQLVQNMELENKQKCVVLILELMVKLSRVVPGRQYFLAMVVSRMEDNDCISFYSNDDETQNHISILLTKLKYILSKQIKQDFTTKSIAPTEDDIENDPLPHLQENIVSKPFDNTFHYLETHFNLYREDYINSLREGIHQYRQNKVLEHENKSYKKNHSYIKDVRVYYGMSLSCPVFDDGLNYVLSFRGKFTRTTDTFLKFGTLVAFSDDEFKTYFFGTISKRNIRAGEIYVKMINNSFEVMWKKFHLPITMIEPTNGYFESYRHVLKVLQSFAKMESEGKLLPFQKYIVQCSKIVHPPSYLEPSTIYYLKQSIQSQNQHVPHAIEIDNGDSERSSPFESDDDSEQNHSDGTRVLDNEWPLPEELEMDENQMDAFKTALSKEFSLIQGPPGCGKTYIGLKIAETLLKNSDPWTGQMMIVCYTNHALDQFLEGILKFTKNVVRFGGRSRNVSLEPYTITVKRREIPEKLKRLKSKAWQKKMSLQDDLNCKYENIKYMKEMILHEEILKDKMGNVYAQFKWRQRRSNCPGIGIWLGVEPAHVVSPCDFINNKFGDDKGDKGARRSNIRNIIQNNFRTIETFVYEASDVFDVFALSYDRRWQLYCYWVKLLCQKKVEDMVNQINAFTEACQQLNEINVLVDKEVIQTSKVIGFTTTCAAKHWDMLQDVKPTIVIIEEAAEVFESHAVASLSSGCKHLILIGDHQQLRPTPATYTLARKYKLDISLFERMVKNKMNFITLNNQHRMRPEIAENLKTRFFYPELKDADNVYQYGNILGIQGNMFFVNHEIPEDERKDSMSKVNIHEAEFLVALCKYLQQQGYSNSDITILTLYKGQVNMIRELVHKQLANPVNIRVEDVDNFQGEESEIVLLSFVRSNKEGRIGFVGRRNRICVALSRAKKGLYMIGNTRALCDRNHQEWQSIINLMKSKKMVGDSLTLICQRHPETKHPVKSKHDFQCIPEGGCQRKCNAHLKCGHVCFRHCHPTDLDHDQYKCEQPCLKKCENGHKCQRRCFETCAKCTEEIIVTLPKCKHTVVINCSDSIDNLMCSERCQKRLPCDHICNKKCSDPCEPCTINVTVLNHQCGHVSEVPCYLQNKGCLHECNKLLACGHTCKKRCHEECEPCLSIIQYTRTKCGHLDEKMCHANEKDEKPCAQDCGLVMDCLHLCTGICGVNDSNVTSDYCVAKLSSCSKGHEVSCDVPCEAVLPCAHQCKGNCITCEKGRRHQKCKLACNKLLPCGHKCNANCNQCMPCMKSRIRKCCHPNEQNCSENVVCSEQCVWRCKHKQCNKKCGMICDRTRCDKFCQNVLSCGHFCIGMCGDPCPTACIVCDSEAFKDIKGHERFVQLLDCGDIISVKHMDEYMDLPISKFGLKKCPLCLEPVLNTRGNRYESRINEIVFMSHTENTFCLQKTKTDELLTIFFHNNYPTKSFDLFDYNSVYLVRKENIISANKAIINRCVSKLKSYTTQKEWFKDLNIFNQLDVIGTQQELQRSLDCEVLINFLTHMTTEDIEKYQEKMNQATDILDTPGPYDEKTRAAFISFVSSELSDPGISHKLSVVQLKLQEIDFNGTDDEMKTITNVLNQEPARNEDGNHIITLVTMVGPLHCDEDGDTLLLRPDKVGVSIQALDELRSKQIPQLSEEKKASKLVQSPTSSRTSGDKRSNKRFAESTNDPRVQYQGLNSPFSARKANREEQSVDRQKHKRHLSTQMDPEAQSKRPRLENHSIDGRGSKHLSADDLRNKLLRR